MVVQEIQDEALQLDLLAGNGDTGGRQIFVGLLERFGRALENSGYKSLFNSGKSGKALSLLLTLVLVLL